jgi:hypothetical protein
VLKSRTKRRKLKMTMENLSIPDHATMDGSFLRIMSKDPQSTHACELEHKPTQHTWSTQVNLGRTQLAEDGATKIVAYKGIFRNTPTDVRITVPQHGE